MKSNPTMFTPTHPDSLLKNEWLFSHHDMPPEKWSKLPSFGSAASWLGMHHSLRKGQNELEYWHRQYLNQKLDWAKYRQHVLQAAYLHYGHLDGHHHLEDDVDFPRLRLLKPELNLGFDLLENDHAQIAAQLQAIQNQLLQLQHAPKEQTHLAESLYQAMHQNGVLLYRHLADEEDLVIPILALES